MRSRTSIRRIKTKRPVINLFRNPSCEGAVTSNFIARKNYAKNPRSVLTPYAPYYGNSDEVMTQVTGLTGNPDGITTGTRLVNQTSSGGFLFDHDTLPAGTWTISAWFYLESGTTISYAFAVLSVQAGDLFNLPTGVWTRVSWTYTSAVPISANTFGLRRTGGAAKSLIATGLLIENFGQKRPFFDGATPNDGTDYRYVWEGTANTVTSLCYVDVPLGFSVPTSSNGRTWGRSNQWSSEGDYSLRIAPFGSSPDSFAQLDNNTSGLPAIAAARGKTYTVLARIRLTRVQVDGDGRSRRISININTPAGNIGIQSPQAPNAPGVYRLATTFTVPSDATAFTNFRFYNGDIGDSAQDVWWDEFMLVEGTYSGPYLDGDQLDWVWDGAQDASSSRGYAPSPQRIRNLDVNPALATTSSRWSSAGASGGGTVTARAAVPELPPNIPYAYRITSPDNLITGCRIFHTLNNLIVGKTYSIAAWIQRLGQNQTLTVTEDTNNTNSQTIRGSGQTTTVSKWERPVGTFVATQPTMYLHLRLIGSTTTGATMQMTGVVLTEQVDYDGTYVDGNTPGWRWEGTPGFSTSVGYPYVEKRYRNWHMSPIPTQNTTLLLSNGSGYGTRWFGNSTAGGSHTLVAAGSDGPLGRAYLRKMWGSLGSGGIGDVGFTLADTPIVAGETIRALTHVRTSAPTVDVINSGSLFMRLRMLCYDSTGTQISGGAGSVTPYLGWKTNQWQQIKGDLTAPTGTVRAVIIVEVYMVGVTSLGTTLDITMTSMIRNPVATDPSIADLVYTDGDTPNWFWEGTPNASTSYGWPYTLENLGLLPDRLRETTGTSATLDPKSQYQAKTMFVVFDVIDLSGAYASPAAEGLTGIGFLGLQMGPAGQASMAFRIDTAASGIPGFNNQIGSGGTGRTVGRHVASVAISQGIQWMRFSLDNRVDGVQAGIPAAGWGPGSNRLTLAYSASTPGIAAYVYDRELSRAERETVHRWIANKHAFALAA